MELLQDGKKSFKKVLKASLEDNTSNYTDKNRTILMSCSLKYFFPFFMIYKDEVNLKKFEYEEKTYYNVRILHVSKTKENDTYIMISYDYCYNRNTDISLDEYMELFRSGNDITYETFKKYENALVHFGNGFNISDGMTVRLI